MPETSSGPSPLSEEEASWLDRTYFAVAEQFTHFGTIQINGEEAPNPTGQHLDSAITQLVGGYSLTPRFALQINIPIIYRSFQRPEGLVIQHGTESGLGDASLLGKFVLFHRQLGGTREPDFSDPKNPRMEVHEPDLSLSVSLLAGVKFPTGATKRLKEEFNESEPPGTPPSGIHGHDLTLGTGSYDGIFGCQASARYKFLFFQTDSQFTWRSAGAHQYRFANDLAWEAGPGIYVLRRPKVIVGVQCVCAGEHKDTDQFRRQRAPDTGITSVFVGPRLVFSYEKISGEVAAEFPTLIDNTSLQVVPDYRLRAGLGLRF